jgi:hypothetical protein
MFGSILAKRTTQIVLFGVLVASVCVSITVPAAAAPQCATVLFIGARGSGQPAGGSSDDGGSGMGPQVYSAYQRLVAGLPSVSVDGLAVDYPARPVELLVIDPTTYFRSIQDGVTAVKATLRRQAKACPGQRLVLTGYSQGAMVMHRVLQDLLARGTSSTRRVMRRVDGVILLADGDRLRRDGVTGLGSAAPGRGISYSSSDLLGARGTRLPPRFTARVFSVCASADVVCDYRSLLQSDASGLDGATIHVQSYTGTPPVLAAADAVAARIV